MNKPISQIVTIFIGSDIPASCPETVFQVPVTLGVPDIQMWASVSGFIVPGGLAIFLKKESAR